MKSIFLKKAGRVLSAVTACMMALTLFPLNAFAAEAKLCSISTLYTVNDKAVEGVTFNLYELAKYTDDNKYQWTEEFEKYHVTVPESWSSEELNALVTTLSAYAARDNLEPLATAKTGSDGMCKFEGMEQGMYMVVGEQYSIKDGAVTTTYVPTPYLVFFPYFNTETNQSGYDATIEAKHTFTSETEKVARHVIKSWADSGYTGNRPESVSMDLLKDGVKIDTVVLNSGNNWRYTWDNLDGGHNYQVVESKVTGRYTTSSVMAGGTYVVTNTYNPLSTPEEPDKPKPRPDPIFTPDRPITVIVENPPILTEYPYTPTVEIEDPQTPLGPKIPQTGQLMWPIPYMAGVGVCLMLAGLFLPAKREEDLNGEEASKD